MPDANLSHELRYVARLSETELEAARKEHGESLGDSDRQFEATIQGPAANLTDAQIIALISDQARDLVVAQEIGSRRAYDRLYCHPLWPGGASGVTIGIGYDIGYATVARFQQDWDGKISAPAIDRLAASCGVTGLSAKAMVPPLNDIVVPWDAAMDVFQHRDMPSYGRLVLGAFPNSETLHPHCFGALFSLVYNCGARMQDKRPGDRQEFRNIRDHLRTGELARIPGEFRSMKRLWQGKGLPGLLTRREAEAVLFETGLAAGAPVAVAAAAPTPNLAAGQLESTGGAQAAGDGAGWGADFDGDGPRTDFESANPAWDQVQWPASDDLSPDYRHITDRHLSGSVFQLTAADLELLFTANAFQPNRTEKRILFGLRGAQLVLGTDDTRPMASQIDRPYLTIRDMRPDHHTFRCVIGSYDLTTNRLSGFVANTVPCPEAVVLCRNGVQNSNLLPCGSYPFVVGTHNGRMGCFIEAAPKTVLRSRNDLVYDIHDVWDACDPYDDIHPSFNNVSAPFSSWGCQNVRGTCPKGTDQHGGEWKLFRQAIGLMAAGAGDHGRKFDYVLLTGLEAAIASDLRKRGNDGNPAVVKPLLNRLRQGSKGPRVAQFQTALGLSVSGTFDAATKKRLTEVQTQRLNWADGIFSSEMENLLQLPGAVFRQPPAGAVVAAAAPLPPAGNTRLESAATGKRNADADLESLYYEIGVRAQVAESQPLRANDMDLPYNESVFQELSVADVTGVGRRLYRRVENSARGLICGDAGDDKADRDMIQQGLNRAASQGADQVENFLALLFASHLGLLMPIAVPAAKVIVNRVLRSSLNELGRAAAETAAPKVQDICKTWITVMRDKEADTGSKAS